MRCRICYDEDVRVLGQKEGYEVAECARCGLVFLPSIEREEKEADVRERPASTERGGPEEGWAPGLQFLAPAFERLGQNGQREILDFGCGQSRIPSLLRARGHRVVGVDLERPVRPHSDRLTGDLLEMEMETGRYDLAYSYQVFEHLPKPRPFLRELLRLTRLGGYVLIHTDMDTPQREESFLDWFYVIVPDHCSYYRRETFEVVLDEEPGRLAWSGPWSVLIEGLPGES